MNSNTNTSKNTFEQCYYGNYNKYWYENNCDNRQTWNQCVGTPCYEKAFDEANKKCCSLSVETADVFIQKYSGCMDKCILDNYDPSNN